MNERSARTCSILLKGVQLSFTKAGTGPDVFLIHGLGAWSLVWQSVIEELSDSFRITALDLPGHGKSGEVPADYSLGLLCDLLHDFAEAVSIEKPLVVAHSFGCLPAARAFSRQNAKGIVLLSPFLGERQSLPWMRPLFSRERGRLFRVRVSALALRKAFLDLVYEPDSLDPSLLEGLLSPLGDEKVRQGILAASGLIAGDIGGALEGLAGDLPPVLLVCGREDPLADRERLASLAREFGARLIVIDRCGHFPQIEHAAELAHIVRTFAHQE